MTGLLPWQVERWRALGRLDKLPAALLLCGPEGIGKASFALALAYALLCKQPQADAQACGRCAACRLAASSNHPDLRVLDVATADEAEESAEEAPAGKKDKAGGNWIKIDAIRGLRDFLALSAHLDGRKVVVIQQADRLHANAANALLKTLEEPLRGTHFLLVTGRVSRLPITVRSRCVQVAFTLPSEHRAMEWLRSEGVESPETALAHAGGAPLRARDQAESAQWAERRRMIDTLFANPDFDVVAAADALPPERLGALIHGLQRWCYDMLLAASVGRIRYHPDCARILHSLVERTSRPAVASYLRDLASAARTLEHPLNPRLVAERCLIGYKTVLRREG